MAESTWKILKLDWKTPGKLLEFFFFQKSGNPAAPVKCSHCTLFSETNTVHVAKNVVIALHRKHLQNSTTELSESIVDIFLLTYSLSSPFMTSH